MQLEKINGHTYYIPAPTNIGVFVFKDKYTLLIDTGNNKQQGRKIAATLEDNNLLVKYIFNTHHHFDHCGGNNYFQENHPGSQFYASAAEKLFIENDYLFATYLYGCSPIKELSRQFNTGAPIKIEQILSPGIVKINEEKFEIIPLAGHSLGQTALATRDKVCFLGDALFSEEIIEKYSFPFLFDIAAQKQSYAKLAELDYDYYVLSHGQEIYSPEKLNTLIKLNQNQLQYFLDLSLELLAQPKTREELLEEICILEDLQLDFKEYYFSLSTVGALTTYLFSQDYLNYQLENGKLYYYKK